MIHSTTTRNRCCIFLLLGAAILFPSTYSHAQTDIEDAIKQLSSDNARGYVQPFFNGFGANMNSGWYHSAEISEMGLHFQFQIVGMGTFIGDGEKSYDAVPPLPYTQSPVHTATLFGDKGAAVTDTSTGLTYHFQNGQVKTSIIPFGTLQGTIGNFYGTQVMIRFVPVPDRDEYPKTTLWGIGARHSISRYLPDFPASLAAGIFYQKLTIGDIMDAHAISFGGQISKSYSLITLYGGLGYETSSLTLTYTNASTGSPVNVDIDGENHVRATAGVSLNLYILDLNADISIGKVTAASAAISFGLLIISATSVITNTTSKGIHMIILRKTFLAILMAGLLGAGILGCDVGVNPFLFDGTPVSADYRFDVNGTSYSGSTTIPLRDVLESIKKDVDSITVINITLLIDSTAGSASPLLISGSSSVDAYTFVTLSNVSLSAFSTERSIFDKSIPGLSFDKTGVDHIRDLLADPESVPETVTATVSGTASSSPIDCSIHVKLYTQVFAKGK